MGFVSALDKETELLVFCVSSDEFILWGTVRSIEARRLYVIECVCTSLHGYVC